MTNRIKELIEMFIEWTRVAFMYKAKAIEIMALSERFSKMSRERQQSFLSMA